MPFLGWGSGGGDWGWGGRKEGRKNGIERTENEEGEEGQDPKGRSKGENAN